jgi:methylated-DNA-[protein]-cysteine S-methyltransferase
MKADFKQQAHTCLVASRFGPVAVVWSPKGSSPRVLRIVLSRPGRPAGPEALTRYPWAQEASCREIDGLAQDIEGFLEGEAVRFPLAAIRMDLCPSFQRRVLMAEHAIPRGRVSTYGRLAGHLGVPRAARAVGNCLAANPFPIVIPCHRAIRSDRTVGGFQGGSKMKRALLEMEGLSFDPSGRTIVGDFFY